MSIGENNNDPYEQAALLGQRLEDALSVDPMVRGRTASLAELSILNTVMDCPEDLVQVLVAEDGNITKRITLEDPWKQDAGYIHLDRVKQPDGKEYTVVDMDEKGWGTVRIDPDTGEMMRIKNDKERRAGLIARRVLAHRLHSHVIKWI